ncbi:MAG: PPC domain-containing protein [Kiritimatiellia bacterium]
MHKTRATIHGLSLFCLAFSVQAASDGFMERTALSGIPISDSASSTGATAEIGEPYHSGQPAAASVWWTWTCPAAGQVEINTHGSNFDTILAVYTGASLAGLTEVASNDDSPSQAPDSQVRFAATAGTVYQIAVDGWQGDTGNITLNILAAPDPPSNDNFALATLISGAAPQTATGTNAGAGAETGEGVIGSGASVWWRWTCPAGQGGTYELDTIGSDFDTALAVYVGTAVDNLSRRALNDDIDAASTTLVSRVRFNAAAGTVYRFTVDGSRFLGDVEGAVTLHLTRVLPAIASPSNDNLASPAALTGTAGAVNGSNVLATGQAGEPDHEFNPVAASVWYSWTPPAATGTAEILLTFTNGVRGVVSVYTGTTLATLVRLDSLVVSQFTNGIRRARFTPPAGQPLRIAVDGSYGDQAAFRLAYRHPLPSPPANDDFANAAVLAGLPAAGGYSNTYATVEAHDGDFAVDPPSSTVWFAWTCPTQGPIRVSATSTAFDPGLVITTGLEASNQTYVADGDGAADFYGDIGVTYRIMVDSFSAEEGAFNLSIEEAPPLAPHNDHLADAEFLAAGAPAVPGLLQNATLEPLEFTNGVTRSVWYFWSAGHDGPAEARVEALAGTGRLTVYAGGDYATLNQVGSTTATNALRVAFDAGWNTLYALQVADDGGNPLPAGFLVSVTHPFPVTTFELTDLARDPAGNLALEWPTVRGVEYRLYAGPGPGDTNNVLLRAEVATGSVMRAACAPPPTNNVSTLFVEAAEAAGVGPGPP